MKRLFMIFLSVFLAFSLISCENREEKRERLKNEKIALGYAKDYIKDKYGFEPEVIEYQSDNEGRVYGVEYYPRLIVTMSHGGRGFITCIDYDGTNGVDSYQHEDICAALSEKVNERIGGLKDLKIKTQNYEAARCLQFVFNDCLCSTYFDGTNLEEVLIEAGASYTAYYIDEYFTEDKVKIFSDEIKGAYVSYVSEEAMEKMPDIRPSDHFEGVSLSMYVNCMQRTDGYHTYFEPEDFGEISYAAFDQTGYDPKAEMTLNRLDKPYRIKSISEADALDTDMNFNDITKTYRIETDPETDIALFIFYKADKGFNKDKLPYVRYSADDGEAGSAEMSLYGEYAVAYRSLVNRTGLTFCISKKNKTE